MDKKVLISLVRSYLDGTASPEERTFVEAWYQEMDSWEPIESILTAAEIDQMEKAIFQTIESRIRVLDAASAASSTPVRTIYPRRFVRLIAAAAVVLFVISGIWLFYNHGAPVPPVYTTVNTQHGKVSKVTLADGSIIWLNADSKMRFPKTFGSGPREIFLEGEAYFEVAKDPGHPFLVHTDDLTTKVLGTKFNVKAYTGMPAIEVTLLEGKVMLSAPAQTPGRKEDTLYLNPNEKAIFAGHGLQHSNLAVTPRSNSAHAIAHADVAGRHPGSTLIREAAPDASQAIAWREGGLVFDHVTLNNVMDAISRKYNIRIHADSVLLHQSISIIIAPTDSAEGALFQITRQLKRDLRHAHGSSSESVQYRREDSVYFIE